MPELEAYKRKRDFSKTPEPPPGEPDAAERNLRFVVQQHAATRMHWDFRLEADGVLKSWPLPKGPTLDPKEKRMAVMVEDHPYDYRTFEGVIPKGEYGGGQVIVWDEGIYTPDEDGVTSWNDKDEGSRRMLEAIARGKVSFTLQGKKLKGSFALIKTKYAPDSWLLIKHRDEHVSERDILQEDASVLSGLTIRDLKEGRLPNPGGQKLEMHPAAKAAPMPDAKRERPMLATLVDKARDAPGWLWEPKLDGIRTIALVKDGSVELRSRRGIDVTKAYPALVASLKTQPVSSMVIDGEVCALDEQGVPCFQLLQPRINLTRQADIAHMEAEVPVVYFVFDMMYLEGYDLHSVPLKERKALLESRLRSIPGVQLVAYIEEAGEALAESARQLGFEGVVGKRADSRYEPGARSRSWVKVKTVSEQEFVVGGYTPGEGARQSSFGALAVGYYDEAGKLRYAGNVGSGFNDKELVTVLKRLEGLRTDKSPFDDKLPGKVAWVRPEMIVQLKFAEWTKDGRLRAPVFEGVRNDIEPQQVRLETPASIEVIEEAADASTSYTPSSSAMKGDVESVLAQLENSKANFVIEVEGQPIKLTNLDKIFWPPHGDAPAYTKRDMIRYYATLAPVLVPHLRDRPLTLTRYPNGIGKSLFYQKHYTQPIPPFVSTTEIWSGSNEETGTYLMCNNLATLVWLAQIADLELHAWMARLDPEPDAHGLSTDASGSEAQIDASVLNYPDYMVFDLDPYIYAGHEAKGAEPEFNKRGWEKTVEIALSLKDVLDQLNLSSFVKTTGKTGIHVYVPIQRHYDYDAVRAATQTLGRYLMQMHPKDITMEWDTSKRNGKVFFDHNQNIRGKTLAAQYSLRPTPWAGVSVPVLWSELPSLDPASFTIASVPGRVAAKGDPWADILAHKNDLAALLGG